jgi:hypothetical protein
VIIGENPGTKTKFYLTMTPSVIFDSSMIAPCGINCGPCMAFLRNRNICYGYRVEFDSKQKTCTQCKIKNCELLKKYLAIDESPTLLEGEWNYTKSVLIKFNNKKEFEDWYYSADYQKILKHRLNAAKCDTILLEGVD